MNKKIYKSIFVPVVTSAIIFGAVNLTACQNTSDSESAAKESATVETQKSTNPSDYPKDSRERFVANLAKAKDISFDVADSQEQQECEKLNLSKDNVEYRTVDKAAKTVTVGDQSVTVHIATEVRCQREADDTGKLSVSSLGSPYLYVPDKPDYEFETGDFAFEQMESKIRISTTGTCDFTDSDGKIIRSKATTFAIQIQLSE